jgi:hypothetical protein
LISIDASLNIPFDATKPLNGHPVWFTQHVNANLFHYWICGNWTHQHRSLSLRNVDSTPYHPWIELRLVSSIPTMMNQTQFDLYLKELPTVATTIIATHMRPHIVWGVTTFPQTWLGTLLVYSHAINGNGHGIIWRKGHVLGQYDQGDTMYVSLCLYSSCTGIQPRPSYHSTVL